jgi:hypothetical protein
MSGLQLWRALGTVLTDAEADRLIEKACPADEPTRPDYVEPATRGGTMSRSFTELAAQAGGYTSVEEMLTAEAWARRCGTPVSRPSEEALRAFADEQDLIARLEREKGAADRRFSEAERAEEDAVFAAYTKRMFPEVTIPTKAA